VGWDAARRVGMARGRSARRRRAVDRMPRRPTDRVEDLVAWLLAAAGLLTLVLAGAVAGAVHGDGVARSVTEVAQRHDAVAELVTHPGPLSGRYQVGVARWTTADGTVHTGRVPVTAVRPGTDGRMRIWIDAAGALSRPPTTAGQALLAAAVTFVAVTLAGLALLAAAWAGVQALVDRRNAARWERDWARVGPRWSRRVH
jgi:hypothetical protein